MRCLDWATRKYRTAEIDVTGVVVLDLGGRRHIWMTTRRSSVISRTA